MVKQWKQWQTLFWGALKSLQMVTEAMKLRCLLLGRKAMTNPDNILKSRDITLPSKFRLVKAMVFPVVTWDMNHQKGWMPKNGCFWAVVLEKTLGVHWTARRSNQSILKGINPEYSLERMMLKASLMAQSIKEYTCQSSRHKRCVWGPWARKIFWRRKWQPTPVFLPAKSHGQRSLMIYSPSGHKE